MRLFFFVPLHSENLHEMEGKVLTVSFVVSVITYAKVSILTMKLEDLNCLCINRFTDDKD